MALVALPNELVEGMNNPPTRFIPYYVQVLPHWYQILKDFSIVRNVEEWRILYNIAEQSLSDDNRVMSDGLFFTILQDSGDSRHKLVFWNHAQAFTGQVDSKREVYPPVLSREDESVKLRIEKEGLSSIQDIQQPSFFEECGHVLIPHGYQHINFFMETGSVGYDFGLEIPDWWWQKVKATCPTPVKEKDVDPFTGYIKLVLARISHHEWDLYREPVAWKYDYCIDTVPQLKNQREGLRQQLGWKTVTLAYDCEVRVVWPEEVEHKYFRLVHRAIRGESML